MKKIGVIGTRKRNSGEAWRKVESALLSLYEEGDWLCSGGCEKGADRFAEKFVKKVGAPILIFYPNYKKYGRGAPMTRNIHVAEHSNIIIACVIRPEDGIDEILKRETGGTEDTLKKFIKRGKNFKDKIILV